MNPIGPVLLVVSVIMELIVWLLIKYPLETETQWKIGVARFVLCGLGLLILEVGFGIALLVSFLYSGIVGGLYEAFRG